MVIRTRILIQPDVCLPRSIQPNIKIVIFTITAETGVSLLDKRMGQPGTVVNQAD